MLNKQEAPCAPSGGRFPRSHGVLYASTGIPRFLLPPAAVKTHRRIFLTQKTQLSFPSCSNPGTAYQVTSFPVRICFCHWSSSVRSNEFHNKRSSTWDQSMESPARFGRSLRVNSESCTLEICRRPLFLKLKSFLLAQSLDKSA